MNAEASIAYAPGFAKEDQQMDSKMIEDEHHKDLGVPKRGVPQNYPKLDHCSIEHVDVGVQPV